MLEIIREGGAELVDSRLLALAVGKELWRYKNSLSLEAEGQFVKHWGFERFSCSCSACGDPGWDWAEGQSYEKQNSGYSTHEEYNVLLILRWLKFPWNRYLITSFAFGEGLSYATKEPPVEINQHAINHGLDYNSSKFLNYLLFEITFALPQLSEWHAILRVHHRSGMFGTMNGVSGGSNFIGAGIKYDF
ncbi:MAG: hypothetical protein JRI91_08600 [Deltaproteobacteria bacterium]|nr:hypothetical protein [Deltaproteobacteria bacterium]